MTRARKAFRIGTRASRLALAQAEWVRDRLAASLAGTKVELVRIRTAGDRDRRTALSAIGGQGVFTREIQNALLDGRIDVAVHSMKDLPIQEPGALAVAAVPEREPANDALISREGIPLAELPEGSLVGTGSPRRRAQLLALRPDLRVAEIRGNVDTRIRKLRDGDYDAVVLALAGLRRLGLKGEVAEVLPFEVMLPAAGQGALAIEMRRDDARRAAVATSLAHPPSALAVDAERRVLSGLGGGCQLPLAVLAEVTGGGALRIRAALAEGCDLRRAERTATAEEAGHAVAEVLRQLRGR